jgi:hypothetical protein
LKNKNILFIGPIVNKKDLSVNKVLSPAANYWQLNFIHSLENNNFKTTLATYIPDQSWPIGKFWVKYPKENKIGVTNTISVNYLNIFFIRELWISFSLFFSIRKKCNDFNVLFTYNPVFRHKFLAILLRLHFKIKWISILADDVIKGKPDLTIFLSKSYFSTALLENKLYFEGGINNYYKPIINNKKILLYAGSLTKWTGIEDFVIFFNSLNNHLNFELHIYGKGESEIINNYISINSRIKYFGFVDDEHLINKCRSAFAFINPRPLIVYNGDNNFPSKILFYLEFLTL